MTSRKLFGLVRKHNLTVKQIVITHAHIDHVGGAMKLRALTGAPIVLNQNDLALLKMLDVQAKWIGVTSPGEVKIDHSIGQEDKLQVGSISASEYFTRPAIRKEASVCTSLFNRN